MFPYCLLEEGNIYVVHSAALNIDLYTKNAGGGVLYQN